MLVGRDSECRAIDDLDRQAEDFQNQGPEVQQAFWDGYETGVSND